MRSWSLIAFVASFAGGAAAQSGPIILQGTMNITGNYYGCNATATVNATFYSAYPGIINTWGDVLSQMTGEGDFSGTLSYSIPCRNLSGSGVAIDGQWSYVGTNPSLFLVEWLGGFNYTVSDAFSQSLTPNWLVTGGNASSGGFSGSYSDANSSITLNLSGSGSPPAPAPSITSLSPNSVVAGSGGFTLTVNGTNFASGASVQWNGTNLNTTFVSTTQLQASVPATLTATSGSPSITVSVNGQTSAAAAFTVNSSQIPDCNHRVVEAGGVLSPCLGPVGITGGIDNTLISVSIFQNQPARITLQAGASNPPLKYSITAGSIPAGFQQTTSPLGNPNLTELFLTGTPATPGTFTFTVTVVDANGYSYSQDLSIIVFAGSPSGNPPTITGISPTSVTAGSSGFTLTVNGSGFNSTSVIQWNGTGLTTNFISSTQLSASIAASLIASAGTVTVQVSNSGQVSTASVFTINPGSNGPGPKVTTKLVSNASGLVNGSCVTPPSVSSFTPSSPQVWLYFVVTGATVGDTATIQWIRPDGVVYTNDYPTVSYTSECFAFTIGISGAPAATYTGTWTIAVFWNNSSTALFTLPFTISSVSQSPLQLQTVAPCRIFNTQNSNGPLGGPSLTAGSSRTIPILSSSCGIPANAVAYSLNVTVVPQGSLSSLTLWPTGTSRPNVSTITTPGGTAVANAAIVPAGTSGSIDVYASDNTDLIVDVDGFFVPPGPGTLQFYPLTPCRIADTRTPAAGGTFPPNSTFGSPSLAASASRSYPIPSSSCGVPLNAAAYSLNLTLVPQGTLGYLTAYPTGQATPFVSTMNSWNGAVLANAAIVPAGTNGEVNIFASNATDLVIDINGYFAPPGTGGLNFYALNPCRLADTRNASGALGGPAIGASATRSFPLTQSTCGIPNYPGVEAYSLSVTAYPQGVLGFLSTWPAGDAQPTVSTLNAWAGQNVANAALVPAGTGGAIDVYVTTVTNVAIDTAGYFGP